MPVLSAALLFSIVGTQSKLGQSDWKPTDMSPLAFAKSIDTGIYNIKGAHGKVQYDWKYFAGGGGKAEFVNRIRDRKAFRVEFMKVDVAKEDQFRTQRLIGLNGTYYLITNGKPKVSLKSGDDLGVSAPNSNPLAEWPMHFQQVMFQSYVNGRGAFQEMVKELTKKSSGFNVEMRKRTVQGARGPIPQIQLLATRTTTEIARKGPATIEIVSETGRWLPLLVRVDVANKKKQTSFFMWQCQWRGPYKFADTWFKP